MTDNPLIGPGAAYSSLPLATVGILDGKYILLPFQPPQLHVIHGSPIYEVSRSIAVTLRDAVTALVDRLQNAQKDGTVETADAYTALRSISPPLLQLEVHLRHELISPYELYLVLCDMAGAVSALNLDHAGPVAPHFQHRDCLQAYKSLQEIIEGSIKHLKRSYRNITFTKTGDGTFVLPIETLEIKTPFYLLLSSAPNMATDLTAQWASETIITLEEDFSTIRTNRMRGAERQIVTLPILQISPYRKTRFS